VTYPIEQSPTVALLDCRYQLHQRVGEGGMSTVYRAEDTILGRTVAVKLLKDDAEVLAAPVRAHREAGALARLNHPGLVTLLEAKLEPDGPRYLVMEYIDGPTLSRLLRDGPLSTLQVAQLADELASGLGAVHAAGLVHRDVKPSNILLTPSPVAGLGFRVKLADFGLAQLADATSVTTPGMVLGTAAYLAPEQVRGQGSCPGSDIYALGLVLLEALSGKRAFSHTSGIGEVMARLMESPSIPEFIEPRWADLLTRMTQADPAARPSALEVAEIVRQLPTGDVGPARTARLPQSTISDTAPARIRARATHRAPTAHRRRARRPGIRAWVAAGAVALAMTVALVCLPWLSAKTGPAPVTVDRVSEQGGEQMPVDMPATDDAPSQNVSDLESPAPVSEVQPATDVTSKADREAQKQAHAEQREAEKQQAAAQRETEKAARDQARQEKKGK
jgi:hypothetical protein